ncbi:MAG TPA: cation diffusion facilitator family transporter [Gemmatimonadales bacterium]|nr:cation diffusion facilitator family transporter [Gemmatimonadales bacterium]
MTQTLPLDVQCAHRVPERSESVRRLALVLVLTAAVMIAEAVGGWFAHSLALLADAGHMLADVGALGLALLVMRMAQRPATPERSYGLVRLEIFAALVNGTALIVIAVGIGLEAVRRLQAPPVVHGGLLLGVAGLGLLANLAGVTMLHRGHDHSLNQRGAYLHVLSDLLGSVGAVVAGIVVVTTGWRLADPIVSLGIGVLVLNGAWRLVRESADVLLEATPTHIGLGTVHERLASLPGVSSVHDLHVWTLTSGVIAMSGHLVVRNPEQNQEILEAARARLEELGIHHVTVQMERDVLCD